MPLPHLFQMAYLTQCTLTTWQSGLLLPACQWRSKACSLSSTRCHVGLALVGFASLPPRHFQYTSAASMVSTEINTYSCTVIRYSVMEEILFLGNLFDSHLNWVSQLRSLKVSCHKALNHLRVLGHYLESYIGYSSTAYIVHISGHWHN